MNDNFIPGSLRHIVNSLNGFQGGGVIGSASGIVRVKVYCLSSELAAGTAVNFSDKGEFCEDAIPCEKLTDPARPWGVIVQRIAPAAIGECIISGPATVKISGSSGAYARPSKSDPLIFQRDSTGAQILFASGNTAVINLGATDSGYSGPFAVTADQNNHIKVRPGFCVINLKEHFVVETTLPVSRSGYVILESRYDGSNPSTPEIKFETNRPEQKKEMVAIVIATVSVLDDNISVVQNHYGDIYAVMWGDCSDTR